MTMEQDPCIVLYCCGINVSSTLFVYHLLNLYNAYNGSSMALLARVVRE